MNNLSTPRYSQKEEFCNSATHAVGALLAVCGTVQLVAMSSAVARAYSYSGRTAAETAAIRES
jgi:predicted membrane channel-forming protein YqfA (hemolysin III family)